MKKLLLLILVLAAVLIVGTASNWGRQEVQAHDEYVLTANIGYVSSVNTSDHCVANLVDRTDYENADIDRVGWINSLVYRSKHDTIIDGETVIDLSQHQLAYDLSDEWYTMNSSYYFRCVIDIDGDDKPDIVSNERQGNSGNPTTYAPDPTIEAYQYLLELYPVALTDYEKATIMQFKLNYNLIDYMLWTDDQAQVKWTAPSMVGATMMGGIDEQLVAVMKAGNSETWTLDALERMGELPYGIIFTDEDHYDECVDYVTNYD